MPGLGTVLGREWALMDREQRLLEPRSAPLEALMGTWVIAAGAQRRPVVRGQPRGRTSTDPG